MSNLARDGRKSAKNRREKGATRDTMYGWDGGPHASEEEPWEHPARLGDQEDAMKASMARLRQLHVSLEDRGDYRSFFDYEGWLASPESLADLGRLLARPVVDQGVDFIVSPESGGYPLGVLSAAFLGCGFVRAQKDKGRAVDSVKLIEHRSRPDYQNKRVTFSWKKDRIPPGSRVYAVDDIVDTGAQLDILKIMVEKSGAHWLGASVLIDTLESHRIRKELNVYALFRGSDL